MYCNPHNNFFVNMLKWAADNLKYYKKGPIYWKNVGCW